MGSKTEAVGSASNVQNINPWTSGQMQTLAGSQSSLLPQLQANTPEAMLNRVLGMQPQFQGLLDFQMGGYADARRRAALSQIGSQATALGGQFAGQNALHSGAFAGALGETIGQGLIGAEADILAQRSGMAQGLTGAGLGLLGQDQQLNMGLLSQVLGLRGQMAAPEWWQPTYVQKPGLGQQLLGLAGGMGMAALTGGASLLGGGGGGGTTAYFNNPWSLTPGVH